MSSGERSWDKLLSDLEHDLRGPLAVIRGEVELVLSQAEASLDDRRRSSASVLRQVDFIEELLVRLSDAASPEAGDHT
jgi:signal transduction histidine kinase